MQPLMFSVRNLSPQKPLLTGSPRFGNVQPEKPTTGHNEASFQEKLKEIEPNTPVAKADPNAKPPQGFLKKALNFGLGLALNGFHVGAALFILAGVPLLHAPVWIGLASLLGVQLFQTWVDKNQNWLEEKFPHFSVRNPDHMRLLSRSMTRRLNQALITGRNVLRKIPLIRRLAPLYVGVATRIRKGTQVASEFATQKLLMGTINASKIPDHVWQRGFWGKLFYFSKVVLTNTLQLITGPFGKVGQWIYKGGVVLFRLQDAADYVNAFATADKPRPSAVTPPPSPPPAQNP